MRIPFEPKGGTLVELNPALLSFRPEVNPSAPCRGEPSRSERDESGAADKPFHDPIPGTSAPTPSASSAIFQPCTGQTWESGPAFASVRPALLHFALDTDGSFAEDPGDFHELICFRTGFRDRYTGVRRAAAKLHGRLYITERSGRDPANDSAERFDEAHSGPRFRRV